MSEDFVTVLMTVYNGGKYLRQSLESVLDQTFKNFEFLIINDCSTDHSLDVIRSFNDKRIVLHNNPSNMGQTKSLNVGLGLAKGDYVARIDADDIALPQWLEKQVQYLKYHSHCSVASCHVLAIDENNVTKKVYKLPIHQQELLLRSLIASPLNHVGSIYRKKDIMTNGGYDPAYRTAADYDLWSKLLRKGHLIAINPELLMAIREHAQSLSRSHQGIPEIEEIKQVAVSNIRAFCDSSFSDVQVELFCRAHYDAGGLTDDEFYEAVNITENIYMAIKRSIVDEDRILGWAKERRKLVYLKRLFALIDQKEFASVKKVSHEAIRKIGFISLFTVFWIASWFGQITLGAIPIVYGRILRWNSRFQLGNQRKVGMFH